MFNKNRNELKELAELCKPIMRFVASKNESSTDCYKIIITEDEIEMVKMELYAPMKIYIEETAQEVPIDENQLEIKNREVEMRMDEKDNEIKIFTEVKLDYVHRREMAIAILKIMEENKLSLNQAVELLDSIKECLGKKRLWN